MSNLQRYQRYVVLGMGCCLGITSGLVGSISSLQNDVKYRLSLSQEQIALMTSMSNLGFNCGLPGGLILEHFGPKLSSLVAMVTASLGYFLFYLSMVYPEKFHGSIFWLVVLTFFLIGLGSMNFLMNALAINNENFRVQHRGKVLGLISSTYFIGYALYSAIYQYAFGKGNLSWFALLAIAAVVLSNILAMVILRKVPLETYEGTEGTLSDPGVDRSAENDNAAEKTKLLGVKTLKFVFYGEFGLAQVFKTLDFHLLLWGFVLSFSVSFMYSFNVEVFLKSVDAMGLRFLLILGPIIAALGKISSGFSSDVTLTRFPRLTYHLVTITLQTITMLMSIFLGDKPVIVVLTSIVQFAALAIFLALTPPILSESYGTKNFARILGTLLLLGALGCLAMSYMEGAFYDLKRDNETNTCYGLECFRMTFIISTVLCTGSFLMLVCLYKRQYSTNGSNDFVIPLQPNRSA